MQKKLIIGGAVLAVVLVVLGSLLVGRNMASGGGVLGASTSSPDSGKYQALFLTNGQVYFGKLSNVGGDYVRLTDIYYLQVQQAVQPTDPNKKEDGASPQTSLVKLGEELHGPQDEMLVSKDQVLFWENLKDDGKVVKAIKDNQAKP
jgi:hypothetical protein